MKDQPWDLNQTLPEGWKWCPITNAPKNFGAPPPNFGHKTSHFYHFFRNFHTRHRISREETPHRQTKKQVSIHNVSPKSWPTLCDLCRETAEIHWLIV